MAITNTLAIPMSCLTLLETTIFNVMWAMIRNSIVSYSVIDGSTSHIHNDAIRGL